MRVKHQAPKNPSKSRFFYVPCKNRLSILISSDNTVDMMLNSYEIPVKTLGPHLLCFVPAKEADITASVRMLPSQSIAQAPRLASLAIIYLYDFGGQQKVRPFLHGFHEP